MFFTQEDYRKIEEYLKQNSKKDTDFKQLLQSEILADDDVVAIVHKGTNYKVSFATLAKVLESERVNTLMDYIKDLQNQINSLQISGVALSNKFGNNSYIGISQKTLTDAINRIWNKFEDITGEITQGISLVVSPEYFIGEEGADVHITANTVGISGIFEHIAFYGNGVLITEADNVEYLEHDLHIDETTVIMCKATILGIEYTHQSIITHYNSFWLGAGSSYLDIMNTQHIIPITNGMRGAYNIDVAQGDRIIIVVGESLAGGFLRADLNSVEINFTESTVTVAGKNYKVFTSEDAYSAGTYNIDING